MYKLVEFSNQSALIVGRDIWWHLLKVLKFSQSYNVTRSPNSINVNVHSLNSKHSQPHFNNRIANWQGCTKCLFSLLCSPSFDPVVCSYCPIKLVCPFECVRGCVFECVLCWSSPHFKLLVSAWCFRSPAGRDDVSHWACELGEPMLT